jgi:hypothetical protein
MAIDCKASMLFRWGLWNQALGPIRESGKKRHPRFHVDPDQNCVRLPMVGNQLKVNLYSRQ